MFELTNQIIHKYITHVKITKKRFKNFFERQKKNSTSSQNFTESSDAVF